MPKENEIIPIRMSNEDFTKYVDTEYKFDRNAVRVFKVAKSVLKAAIAYLDEIEEELSEITKSILKIIYGYFFYFKKNISNFLIILFLMSKYYLHSYFLNNDKNVWAADLLLTILCKFLFALYY